MFAQLQRMSRVGTCLGCHHVDDAFWQKLGEKTGVLEAPTDETHQEAIRAILEHTATP